MLFNGFAQRVSTESLGDISDNNDLRIGPASYAFGIWGVIYFLLAVFTVY